MLWMMFHLNRHAWLESSKRREQMVQYLLRSRAERISPHAHLDPAALVARRALVPVIALCSLACMEHDDVAIIRQVHSSFSISPARIASPRGRGYSGYDQPSTHSSPSS